MQSVIDNNNINNLKNFSISGNLIELVGISVNDELSIYLDNVQDNSPIKNAQLELLINDSNITLEFIKDLNIYKAKLEHEIIDAKNITIKAKIHTQEYSQELKTSFNNISNIDEKDINQQNQSFNLNNLLVKLLVIMAIIILIISLILIYKKYLKNKTNSKNNV